MEDQQLCTFWFKITPTDIISNTKVKTNSQKSILIKLGNREAKCKNIGQSIEMNVEVLYSKTLNKFCPIKGIIKVYDVNKDGSEMISCVGAFNTEDLLSDKPKITNLERNIGPCRVLLAVQVRKLETQTQQSATATRKQPDTNKSSNNSKLPQINKLSQINQNSLRIMDRMFIKSPTYYENQCQESPYLIDDSNDNIEDISGSKDSEFSEESKRNEREIMGQELVQERRKNKALEEKLQKNSIKLQLLRKNLFQKNQQIKQYYQSFRNFTQGLDCDAKGQYIFEMNERKKEVSLKYKPNIKFKQVFEEFIAFIIKKINENGSGAMGSEKTIEEQNEINRFTTRLQILENEKKRHIQENSRLTNQLNSIKHQLSLKISQLGIKEQTIRKKIQEIVNLQQKLRRLNEEKKDLQGLNQYLQERDAQMQNLINNKENTIENLSKIVTENNLELDSLEQKNNKLVKIVNNLELTIQEMKQENANLLQTIDNYRQKYGDLKAAKDRALEREIKQCLRWIDQQNRDEQLSLEDTTLEFSQTPAVTSIMRSIRQIQNMPLQEISLIRKEVIGVLKRLDEFVAKNSLGMPP